MIMRVINGTDVSKWTLTKHDVIDLYIDEISKIYENQFVEFEFSTILEYGIEDDLETIRKSRVQKFYKYISNSKATRISAVLILLCITFS